MINPNSIGDAMSSMNEYQPPKLATAPTVGSVWRHDNGREYTVIGMSNIDSYQPDKWPVTVIYVSSYGKVYNRPLREWVDKFTEIDKVSITTVRALCDYVQPKEGNKYYV